MDIVIEFVSLDALLENAADAELDGDDMTINTCSQAYVNAVLEGIPEEGGDLVDLMSA